MMIFYFHLYHFICLSSSPLPRESNPSQSIPCPWPTQPLPRSPWRRIGQSIIYQLKILLLHTFLQVTVQIIIHDFWWPINHFPFTLQSNTSYSFLKCRWRLCLLFLVNYPNINEQRFLAVFLGLFMQLFACHIGVGLCCSLSCTLGPRAPNAAPAGFFSCSLLPSTPQRGQIHHHITGQTGWWPLSQSLPVSAQAWRWLGGAFLHRLKQAAAGSQECLLSALPFPWLGPKRNF